jgi:hypothetical protein
VFATVWWTKGEVKSYCEWRGLNDGLENDIFDGAP